MNDKNVKKNFIILTDANKGDDNEDSTIFITKSISNTLSQNLLNLVATEIVTLR